MQKKISQNSVIVVCDSLSEQARLTALLAQDYDNIIGCQLAQLEAAIERENNPRIVAGWKRPDAELRLIIDVVRQYQSPLLVVLESITSNNINRLPDKSDYILLPSEVKTSLQPWLEHAVVARESMQKMEQEIASLTNKLEERKVIEKAKGLLMKMHNVDEQSAYRALQKSAMQSSQSLAQVAKNLLITLETLN